MINLETITPKSLVLVNDRNGEFVAKVDWICTVNKQKFAQLTKSNGYSFIQSLKTCSLYRVFCGGKYWDAFGNESDSGAF